MNITEKISICLHKEKKEAKKKKKIFSNKKNNEKEKENLIKKIKILNKRKKKCNTFFFNKNIMFHIYEYLNLRDFYCLLWTQEYIFSKRFVQYMNRHYTMYAKCLILDHLELHMGDHFIVRTIAWMLNSHGFTKYANYMNKKIGNNYQYKTLYVE